jgi:hypothetical protein
MPEAQISRLKQISQWAAVLGTCIFTIAALIEISSIAVSERDLIGSLLRDHIRAIVGLPMAAAVAFCLVTILEATSGNIEFKALGFEFKGASGPIVLWVLSFLAIVGALRILW